MFSLRSTPQAAIQRYQTQQPQNNNPGWNNLRLHIGKLTKVDNDKGRLTFRLDGQGDASEVIAQALVPYAATDHGMFISYRHENLIPGTDPAGMPLDVFTPTMKRDMYAVIGHPEGKNFEAVVLGWFQPQVNQYNTDKIDYVMRHAGDHYSLITQKDGTDYGNTLSTAASDLSGTVYHKDLAKDDPYNYDPGQDGPKNYDHNFMPWTLDQDGNYHITTIQQSGRTRIQQRANGDLVMQHDNGTVVQLHNTGQISLHSPNLIYLTGETITLEGQVHINGNLSMAGDINAGSVSAPNGGVPGPLAPAGAPGNNGPTIGHTATRTWRQ